MNEELKTIKKIYGEEMMHLCRDMFPSILEKKGLLLSILKSNLAPTHSFVDDIKEGSLYDEFKSWIYSLIALKPKNLITTNKTPFELMDEAGYTLYECKSEDDIQGFRKYYAKNEVLCTIYNGGRLDRCRVFFAVKKNVDEIKRENFTNPKREDEYGTSVISIQFSKGKTNDLSIKNRYNHTVNNPDATFSNNLENIIPGLSKSFEEYYGLNIYQNINKKSNFLRRNLRYIQAINGKFYRYNLELDGIYYCENNIIVQDGKAITKYANNPERYILIEQYLIDLKKKSITLLQGNQEEDAFINSIYDIGNITKIMVTKNGNNKIIIFSYEEDKEVKIEVDKNNTIVGYENNYVLEIGYRFLKYNRTLSSISLAKVQTIGNEFLYHNNQLNNISLPQVRTIGNAFLVYNEQLSSISLPNVRTIGNRFLEYNLGLSSISLPQVQTIENEFLLSNEQLTNILLPQVQTIGCCFLYWNDELSSILLPKVQTIGDWFLGHNRVLSSISLPNTRIIGDDFLKENLTLSSISLPNVQITEDGFLYNNERLRNISLPQVQTIGDNFLFYNRALINISLPNVRKIGDNFLAWNEQLRSISLPRALTIGTCFLSYNKELSSILLPNVQTMGRYFLSENHIIDKEEYLKLLNKTL